MRSKKTRRHNLLLKIQGTYYILTGVWPLISMSTFLQVTGPKTDLWLVKTVGMLILVNGLVLLNTSFSVRRNNAVGFLAMGLCIGFALVDTIFYFQGLISPVYLLDAAFELLLYILWTVNYTWGGKI